LFEFYIEKVHNVDIVVAYLPTASMGSSVELWEARRTKKTIWTITTLPSNWIIRMCSTKIFSDFKAFEEFMIQQFV